MIEKRCPMCGRYFTMILTDEELESYEAYMDGDGKIQDCLPNLNPMEREFLKTGYCPECQKMLFRSKYTSEKIYED